MKTLLFIISISVFAFSSLNAQTGWFTVYSETDFLGQSNFFTDANTGYNVGLKYTGGIDSPRVLKTTDAGNSWFEQITPIRDSAYFWFRSVFFINTNTGFLTAANSTSAFIGRILKTTDGGNSWFTVSFHSRHLINIYFVNSSTGFATGYQTILKTTDTGVTWQYQNPGNFSCIGIHFTSTDTGYIAANTGRIFKTTNAGDNWNLLTTGTAQHIWDIHFIDANTGFAAGGNPNNSQNVILRTTNAGLNWTQIPYNFSTCLLWSVRFVSPNTGWIMGWCNQILKTIDGGLTWHFQTSPTANYYRTCFFTDALTGYIAGEPLIGGGEPGYILKTTEAGGGPPITLNLTMFIEGFYNSTLESQVTDTIKVILRDGFPPYAPVDSAEAVVSSNGTAQLIFSNAPVGEVYYIVLKHRNSLETWSAYGVGMDGFVTYDFSTDATQAYGDNMVQVDTSTVRFAIYSGDVNQDLVADGTDAALIDNDAFKFVTGYVVTDVNGDEIVDGSDAAIVDNNASNFVSSVTPLESQVVVRMELPASIKIPEIENAEIEDMEVDDMEMLGISKLRSNTK